MSRIATLGVSSCATIAIAGFKDGQREINEKYKADPSSYKEPAGGLSVDQFYHNILVPTSQPLGHTKEMPFEKLMQDLDKNAMKTKFTMACLNESSYRAKDNYWPKELARWGFKLTAKTGNTLGSMNYLYVRAPLAEAIKPEEV